MCAPKYIGAIMFLLFIIRMATLVRIFFFIGASVHTIILSLSLFSIFLTYISFLQLRQITFPVSIYHSRVYVVNWQLRLMMFYPIAFYSLF